MRSLECLLESFQKKIYLSGIHLILNIYLALYDTILEEKENYDKNRPHPHE